jgi:hypothetical protein
MTTMPTSQKLADALRAAKFEALAKRAEANEFNEFFSPHALPQMVLAEILAAVVGEPGMTERERLAAHHLRMRLIDGEFDATDEEAAAWAQSEEGKDAFKRLGGGRAPVDNS